MTGWEFPQPKHQHGGCNSLSLLVRRVLGARWRSNQMAVCWHIYGPASLGTSPPPHPMVMGLYSSAPVPPPPCGVGGVGGGGSWCTPLPLWCGWCGWWWVVVGGGGGRSCICMYMNVSVPPSPLWCGWCGWWWVVVVVVEEVVYVCIWMYMYGMNVYF